MSTEALHNMHERGGGGAVGLAPLPDLERGSEGQQGGSKGTQGASQVEGCHGWNAGQDAAEDAVQGVPGEGIHRCYLQRSNHG